MSCECVDLIHPAGGYNKSAGFIWAENFLASKMSLGFSRNTSGPAVCIMRHENTEHAETNISTTFVLIINLAISSKKAMGKNL
jgi:hypothetical protein